MASLRLSRSRVMSPLREMSSTAVSWTAIPKEEDEDAADDPVDYDSKLSSFHSRGHCGRNAPHDLCFHTFRRYLEDDHPGNNPRGGQLPGVTRVEVDGEDVTKAVVLEGFRKGAFLKYELQIATSAAGFFVFQRRASIPTASSSPDLPDANRSCLGLHNISLGCPLMIGMENTLK